MTLAKLRAPENQDRVFDLEFGNCSLPIRAMDVPRRGQRTRVSGPGLPDVEFLDQTRDRVRS